MNAPEDAPVIASWSHETLGYRSFQLGAFRFRRDEYFAHVGVENAGWPQPQPHPRRGQLPARADARCGLGFFYGWVNFDHVLGTVNHYGTVDLFAGSYNATLKAAGVDLLETFPTEQIRGTFEQMLDDWTNADFDPFCAPQKTGSAYGRKNGYNTATLTRQRELAQRCVGLLT